MGIAERRQRERARRRNAIVDAAEKVFFARGIEAATMEEIAREAELSKGLLYFYFNSKESLFDAIAERGESLLERLFREAVASKEKGIDQLEAIGRAYVHFAGQYADYFDTMVHNDARRMDSDSAPSPDRHRAIAIVAQAVETGIQDGSVRGNLDPMQTAVVLWAQTHGLLQISRLAGEMIDFDATREFAFAFVREALRTRREGTTTGHGAGPEHA